MPRNRSSGFIKLTVLLKLSGLLTTRTSVSLPALLARHVTLKFQGEKKMSCDELGQQARPCAPKTFLFESLNVYLHIDLKY